MYLLHREAVAETAGGIMTEAMTTVGETGTQAGETTKTTAEARTVTTTDMVMVRPTVITRKK